MCCSNSEEITSHSAESMQIFIKTLAGRTIIMEVESTTTIERIKAEIQVREDILAENQRLLFNGAQLEEGNTLFRDLSEERQKIYTHTHRVPQQCQTCPNE